MVIPIATL